MTRKLGKLARLTAVSVRVDVSTVLYEKYNLEPDLIVRLCEQQTKQESKINASTGTLTFDFETKL